MSTTRAVSKSSVAHSPYQRLFMLPGAKAFCLSGAVARLPISMMSLGIVSRKLNLFPAAFIGPFYSGLGFALFLCVVRFIIAFFKKHVLQCETSFIRMQSGQ